MKALLRAACRVDACDGAAMGLCRAAVPGGNGHTRWAAWGGGPGWDQGAGGANPRQAMARLAWLCCVLGFSGCTSLPAMDGGRTPSLPSQIVQIWEYPASEFPAMCMLMHADGSLRFRGGFSYFNTGTWRQGNKPGAIVITLGGSMAFPTASAKDALKARPRSLESFDAAQRELQFDVKASADSFLTVGGFNFFRSARCNAV